MFLRTLFLSISASLLFTDAAFAQSTPMPTPPAAPPTHEGHAHNDNAQTPQSQPQFLPGTFSELDSDRTIGAETAPITLIIYASVTCPHCSLWFTTIWPDIKANYVDTGQVRIVFRGLPYPGRRFAMAGFTIAACAPEDKYFELIEHQMVEFPKIREAINSGKALETYLDIGSRAGIHSQEELKTCLNTVAHQEEIAHSEALAAAAGIESVPKFIINGELFPHEPDFLPLSKYFESLLNQGFSPLPKR